MPPPSATPPGPPAPRWSHLVVLVLTGVALSLVAFFVLRDAEEHRIRDALGYAAGQVAGEIDARLTRDIAAATQLRALYDASDEVERREFDAFAAVVLEQRPRVICAAWVPVVAVGEADSLVASVHAGSAAAARLRDLPDTDAPARDRRAPIIYVAPESFSGVVGLDLSSSTAWNEALEAAGGGTDPLVFELPPLIGTGSGAYLLTVVAPVRERGERRTLSGFIVTQSGGAGLVDGISTDDLDITLRDAHGHLVAQRRLPAEGELTSLEHRIDFVAGSSSWQLVARPGSRFVSLRHGGFPWFVMILGLVGTTFAALYVRSLTLATHRATRTAAELLASRRALEHETHERHVLEERIRHAQKMEAMGTLAGGIAHDFNNILSAILGYTDLAAEEAPPHSELRSYLDEVSQAGRRAADLVSQILAFSRQTARERRPMALHTVVREALKLLRGSIPPTIEIRDEIDRRCPRVQADATEIHQVVMNLCTNAYNAMREGGGTLVVSLSPATLGPEEAALDPRMRPGDYVRLTVSDTGHGMSPETQRRIFEPYFTTGEPGRGTGLGLATVHGIVDAMDGVIHVYSELGHGSTFNVFFPALAAPDGARPGPTIVHAELHGTERVLLVDDEAAITTFAAAALERLGYHVTTTTHGPDALALLNQAPRRFDVVITDQMMPKLRGSELAAEIRRLRPDLPIILCSGFGDVLDHARGDAHLFDDYITKPVIAADLAQAIRRVVSRPRHEAGPDGVPAATA